MYRFFVALFLITFSTGLLPVNIQPAEASRTIVTRTPYYNYRPYRAPSHSFRHNYRNPRHYNRRVYRPPINRSFNTFHRSYYPSTSFSDINALEKYALNKNFGRESDLQRLERLEMQAFGAIQPGDISTRYDNVRGAILSRPQQNYRTSFLRNIGNFFSGQMTGFTPSIDNDPFFSSSGFTSTPFPSTFGNSTVTQYSGPFGSGYRINNYGTGSSAGVRILD